VGVVTKDVPRAKLEGRKRQVRLGQLDLMNAKIPTVAEYKSDYIKYIKDEKKIDLGNQHSTILSN